MKSQFFLVCGLSFIFFSCVHKATEDLSDRSIATVGKPSRKPLFLPGKTSPRKDFSVPYGMQASKAFAPETSLVYYKQLINDADFEKAATLSEGFIKGAVVKFLIDNRTSPAQIYFINGNYTEDGVRPEFVQYHYYFAENQLPSMKYNLDTFNKHTYFTNDLKQKYFIAGTLQKYNVIQNGVETPFLGIQFYPQDYISDQSMLFAADIVKKAIQFDTYPLKLVSSGSQQDNLSIKDQLAELKITPTSVDQIYSGVSYIPMELGKAYGYLRLNPKGAELDQLSPTDIPVFDELPLDLSVVSAVITTVVQDAGSHVNLKSKERRTPNMVLKDPVQIKELEKFNGQPIQLIVENESYKILPSTDQIVKNEYINKNKNKKWIKISSGVAKEFISFDNLALKSTPLKLVQSSKSYGGKASKLALLAHPKIAGIGSSLQKKTGYRLTPIGFAVPVSAYQDFVKSNPELQKKIEVLANAEMGINGETPPSPQKRIELVHEIQDLFYQTPISPSLSQELTLRVSELKAFTDKTYPLSPVKKIKIRSSANAEDIPQFDGAGLHSSFSAKIKDIGDPQAVCKVVVSQDGVTTKEEVEPETVMCAVKGVFASLWNKRAIEERNYARIDQTSAVMGLAVNTSYDFRDKTEGIKEIANAVLVTRIINTKGVYGYRLSLNTDDNLVTNPTPGTQAEIVYASFIAMSEVPQMTFIQYAKTQAQQDVLQKPLLNPDVYKKMIDIARSVEYAYCQNIPAYYPNQSCEYVVSDADKPTSLDMEFKIYSNGEVLLKQAREFSGK